LRKQIQAVFTRIFHYFHQRVFSPGSLSLSEKVETRRSKNTLESQEILSQLLLGILVGVVRRRDLDHRVVVLAQFYQMPVE